MLQVNAFGAQSNSPDAPASSLPIQLQMPSAGNLSDRTVGQQAAALADLATAVEAKRAEVKQQAEALPTIWKLGFLTLKPIRSSWPPE